MLHIVYEDNHLIGVIKPAGMLIQGDHTGDESLVERVGSWLRMNYDKPGDAFVGCIHRLDRPVSGLVLLAKTSKGLERMNKIFEQREVVKKYMARVKGVPDIHEATLVHYLEKDERANKAKAHSREVKGSKRAELSYKLIGRLGNEAILEIEPKTGRPHQIRAQLAKIGHPIKGDLKYGYPTPNPDGSICLASISLSFIHPVKKEPVFIKGPIPEWGI
jgi:23S rRNA pseudouridine1911/1915/1917 synthase